MEKRIKNIHQPYSEMRRCLGVVFAILTCLFMSMPLCAQEISVIYDYGKQTLIIDNQKGIPIYLYPEDNMPKDLQVYIQENGDSTADCLFGINKGECRVIKVDSTQVYGFETLTVGMSLEGGKPTKTTKVHIDFQNRFADDNMGKQQNKPFYEEWFSDTKKVLYCVAGGSLIVLILFVVIVLSLKRKKKLCNSDNIDRNDLQVIEEEKNDYIVGLDYIRQSPEEYFVINMEEFCSDTAVKKIYFSRRVVKSLNGYFKAFLEKPERTNETGCYLIGGWETIVENDEQYNISLEEVVFPGDDAVYDEYSLNFGLKIGIKLGCDIRNISEKTGRDYVHTAWMHSHPGLGLFLSSHDLLVQRQLTYPDAPKRMVAIVIDTNTPDWQMAFFTAKNSGEMNNKDDLRKTISFDVLNEWGRLRTSESRSIATIENSFFVLTEDKQDEFAFSAKTINQIDDVVYEASSEESCSLYGEIHQDEAKRTRVITACGISGEDSQIGLLVVESENDGTFDVHRYNERLAKTDFCLVYRSEQECYLVWQSPDRTNRFIRTSLKEMKEWTRRKRV